ncbi:hypothetical protein VN12_19715 [Pirellula sp. SH-Sr6A]|uniref:hypothetical protein n=1 Tax=Pirellula sp. SH-Sr6A TaxID=1632865 RepID=UPI00078C4E43|nr:hypothetical protein [Pirellula sp. SH-Sr6A]AMV30874.1 hypothetical protein VN12_02075 [Pirellula sp. SH-Sr6A]AMV31298.1 hypothetical protein VN12_04220 [Pirellula sp. SH-Sr6A]AMV34363.1 hypothetical protein VN12_19715 [Pirellula sp. SH-Sr6A]
MTTTPYELLARFNADGTIAGVHVRHLLTVGEKAIELDPVPLSDTSDPAFTQFAEAFAAAAVAERDALQAQLATAQARIAELEEALPWNPRIMEAKAFVARITASEMLTLAGSQDETVQGIVGMLTQWVANDWPIILDSPEMQQAIGYLGQAGIVTSDRVAELLRDCVRSEAHVADGQ